MDICTDSSDYTKILCRWQPQNMSKIKNTFYLSFSLSSSTRNTCAMHLRQFLNLPMSHMAAIQNVTKNSSSHSWVRSNVLCGMLRPCHSVGVWCYVPPSLADCCHMPPRLVSSGATCELVDIGCCFCLIPSVPECLQEILQQGYLKAWPTLIQTTSLQIVALMLPCHFHTCGGNPHQKSHQSGRISWDGSSSSCPSEHHHRKSACTRR